LLVKTLTIWVLRKAWQHQLRRSLRSYQKLWRSSVQTAARSRPLRRISRRAFGTLRPANPLHRDSNTTAAYVQCDSVPTGSELRPLRARKPPASGTLTHQKEAASVVFVLTPLVLGGASIWPAARGILVCRSPGYSRFSELNRVPTPTSMPLKVAT